MERIENGNENIGIILEEFLRKPGTTNRSCNHIYKYLKEKFITNNVEGFEELLAKKLSGDFSLD